MQLPANESLEGTPVGGSFAAVTVAVSLVSDIALLGLPELAMIGLLLISPGCGQPT